MQQLNVESLAQLEAQIRLGPRHDDFHTARRLLREWLFAQLGLDPSGSIGDAIAELVDKKPPLFGPTCVILRCLAVQELIPAGVGNTNNRAVCDLVENSFPYLVDFLSVDPKTQTFQKYKRYESFHDWVCGQLKPLSASYIGLDSLISAKSAIISGLNHRAVRQYGEVFKMSEIRSVVDSVLSHLKKVSEQQPTLLQDVDEARRAIDEGGIIGAENGSFLYHEFLLPFLASAKTALDEFLSTVRGKFSTEIVKPSGTTLDLQKRYPIHEVERVIEIRFPLRNVGPGLAIAVTASVTSDSEDVVLSNHEMLIGNVAAGDFSISADAMVINSCREFRAVLIVEWGEIGSPRRSSEIFEYRVHAQRADVKWNDLEYLNPYSTEPAEGANFVGRREMVRGLAAKILRSPMEPFYITGQKRVGKTSLAIACADSAVDHAQSAEIEYKEILWGAIANEDARLSARELGRTIEAFITTHFPPGVPYPQSDYTGSLSPLIRLADLARKIVPKKKFVFILDEFDEIHQELYLHGNLAETFFANIRALAGIKNITLILVGGENMPFIMDRQGQKLNKFTRYNLSYFSRDFEWEDYKELVRHPVAGSISWHEDGIAELFNVTNGNPYFTNILCAAVLRNAVEGRDADVTAREVKDAIGIAISSLDANSFIHLWQDGIFKPIAEREPEILRRGRVLVAIARCMRSREQLTLAKIAEHKGNALLADNEISPVLNDFVRRDVLYENTGTYNFRLPLFALWLKDVGMASLVADSLSEELASAFRADEELARVRSDEIVLLTRSWPTFRGQHISAEDVRAWLEQVEGHRNQRLLFKLLSGLKFYGEAEIRERLRAAHANLKKTLPEFIQRKRNEKRKDVVITYVDGEGKSGQYHASTYAEENRIDVGSIIPPAVFNESISKYVEKNGRPFSLVIVDDIGGTGDTIAGKLSDFVDAHRSALEYLASPIILALLVATPKAISKIEEQIRRIEGLDIELRVGEILGSDAFAFDAQNPTWDNSDERDRAKALCRELGAKLDKHRPFGYGDLGLMVVFPSTTPNNSLPILHSSAKVSGGGRWKPLFPRVSN